MGDTADRGDDTADELKEFATGGIVTGPLHGVIGCGCGQLGYLIPPGRYRVNDDGSCEKESEPYDERESNP